jgi:hypothetical protein
MNQFFSISDFIISRENWKVHVIEKDLDNLSTASWSPSPHREEISLPVRGAAEG